MMWSTVGAVWAEPSITGIGRLPMHVPLERAEAIRLNGEWDFDLWDHPDQVPIDALSTTTTSMKVTVPGNWTLQGTGDLPHYTNVQMPFADLPPQIPARCPTGLYRRIVTIPEDFAGRRVVLRVEGAESVHLVYLDGHFIGYGTDSRLPSEYEISSYVCPGAEHQLAIFVLRYSAQSYLEDQDQWWMAGLHREVVIEARPMVHLCDLICAADWDPVTGHGRVEVTAEVSFGDVAVAGHTVEIEIRDMAGTVIATTSPQVVPHRARAPYVFAGHRIRADLQLGVVTPWSAEQPVRYRVVAILRDADGAEIDQVATWTGCRRVEVRNRQLLVNGQAIWIFGVNRHDHHPDRGKALTEQDLRDDLVAMRAHNITAIRTAHYPNHHRLYDLCDELGMYVIDEANIEGHAFNTSLCDDPQYLAAFMERGSRMVHRDRNHPSIIAWSLGNETGYGAHHDALAGWIRHTDPSRPLHYEGAIFHGERQTASRDRPPWAHGGRAASDIVCPMYPSIDAIRDYGASGEGDRPLIMCEYSHAMGNSNGSLAEYWEVITATPGLQGGFIWEWKDHSLRDPNDPSRLVHGGDFGDTPHDGNFVADGLLGADGDPHPALSEVAWVYRPVTVTAADGEGGSLRVRLTNRRFFSDLSDLEARWEITVDGERGAAGVWELPVIGPQTTIEMGFPLEAADCIARAITESELVLSVIWLLRGDSWYAPSGHLEAWDQILLRERHSPLEIADGASSPNTQQVIKVEPWIWRAATDNDGFKLLPDLSERLGIGGRALSKWTAAGMPDRAASEVIEIHYVTEAAPGGGQIHRCRYVVTEEMADLPRLGLRCAITANLRHITWWGLGPGENYPDRAAGARRGIWTALPEQMPYLIPQEYGRRGETRWVRLRDPTTPDGAQVALEVRAIEPAKFSFSVSPYSTERLLRCANAADLVEEDVLWLHVDLHHRGLGTASCGPDVRPQYRIEPGEYELAVWIGMTGER